VAQLESQLAEGRIGRREFVRMAAILGVALPAAYSMAGRITGKAFVEEARAADPKQGGVIKVSMNVKEVSDPAVFDWSEKGNVARHVIEPLVRINKDNVATPHLAERWEASDDLKTWTFYLRKGVKWSNGDDFTAEHVAWNFNRWLDPATGSSNQGRFSSMTKQVDTGEKDEDGNPKMSTVAADNAVEVVDAHTIRFNLANADLALPESMGDYPALIAHPDSIKEGSTWDQNPIGTGPFKLTGFKVGEYARYERADNPWWGGEVYLDGIQYIDHGDDPSAQLAALASGQVHANYRTGVEQVTATKAIPTLNLLDVVTAQTGVARMKVTEAPFDNPKVRQAIQACVDHTQLLEVAYQSLGSPGEDHHVAPIHPEYAELPRLKQDYDKAKQLLAEAGYEDGLEVQIDCVANPTWEQNTCLALSEMVKPAGITMNVNVMPGGTYWDRWLTAPLGFTSWTHRALGVQVLNLAYRSGVAWNETSYSNPEFDKLLDKAGTLVDVDERRKVMAELEAILQGDAVIVQPFWRSEFMAANKVVKNIYVHVANEHHFEKVWLDT
jgi:peptide/nickel transport system substrate-binding protein